MNNNDPPTLSQHIHKIFFDSKGHYLFDTLKSYDATGMYDSYIQTNKIIVSGLTLQSHQITFIRKYTKRE